MTTTEVHEQAKALPDEPLGVVQAVSAAMGAIRNVAKTGQNKAQGEGYYFRGVDAVMNAAGPAFRDHGVVVVPHKIKQVTYTPIEVGKYNTKMTSVRVTVVYRWYGPRGRLDFFDTPIIAEAFDSGDKGTSKAMSVAYRTLLIQALTLPTDAPKDPDEETYELSSGVTGRGNPPPAEPEGPTWLQRVNAVRGDAEGMRKLWAEAAHAKAPQRVFDALNHYAQEMKPAEEPATPTPDAPPDEPGPDAAHTGHPHQEAAGAAVKEWAGDKFAPPAAGAKRYEGAELLARAQWKKNYDIGVGVNGVPALNALIRQAHRAVWDDYEAMAVDAVVDAENNRAMAAEQAGDRNE